MEYTSKFLHSHFSASFTFSLFYFTRFAPLEKNSYKIELMRFFAFCLLPFAFLFGACRPAATPVSVSEKPVSINNVPQTNVLLPPTKNIGNLGWTLFFDEKTQTLRELKGKVVVLDFWATYCPPCLEEIPHLVSLQNQYGSENFQIIGLHVGGEEDRPKVPEFVERLKMNYPLATPDDELTDILFGGESAIPQTFVFDRNGQLIQKFIGYDEEIKNALNRAVEFSLNQ